MKTCLVKEISTNDHILYNFICVISLIGKSPETKGRKVDFARTLKEKDGEWGMITDGYKFSFGSYGNVLELGCNDGYTSL